MDETVTEIRLMLVILQLVLQAGEQAVEVTEELLRQHEEQRRQEMALLEEVAWLQEMEQRNHALPEVSLLLSACQHWWFWASAEMLLILFAFYWLPRHGSSSYDSSAWEETPAEPRFRKKRRRRRRRRRGRGKRMQGIADYCDKLDQIRLLDKRPEWKDMQNLEEEGMKGMISASAKRFPQKTFGQSCIQGIHQCPFFDYMFLPAQKQLVF